jgi:hypothetical protein
MALTKKQMLALELDLQGYSTTQMSQELNTSMPTIIKWRKNPEYQEQYNKRISQIVYRAEQRIKAAADMALDKLIELAQCGNPRIELAASNSLLDRSLGKARERIELQADVNQRPLQNISEEQLKKLVEEDEQ